MRCPECDAFVKSTAVKCPNCGHNMSKAKRGKGSKGKSGRKKDKGRRGAKGKIIDRRGEEDEFLSIFNSKSDEEYKEDKELGTDWTKLAAFFLFLSGLDAIISGLYRLFFIDKRALERTFSMIFETSDVELAYNVMRVCSVGMIILGLLVIIGSFLALRKKNWPLCLIFSIIGLFTRGEALTATALAFGGLVLIIKSRKHFDTFKQAPMDIVKSYPPKL